MHAPLPDARSSAPPPVPIRSSSAASSPQSVSAGRTPPSSGGSSPNTPQYDQLLLKYKNVSRSYDALKHIAGKGALLRLKCEIERERERVRTGERRRGVGLVRFALRVCLSSGENWKTFVTTTSQHQDYREAVQHANPLYIFTHVFTHVPCHAHHPMSVPYL